jgi:alpha-L-rhamnosidase
MIHPAMVGDLTWVKGKYDSVHGPITTEWHRNGRTISLAVSIPANTAATIFIPAPTPDKIMEGNRRATTSAGVTFLRMDEGCAVFAVESGSYTFASRL